MDGPRQRPSAAGGADGNDSPVRTNGASSSGASTTDTAAASPAAPAAGKGSANGGKKPKTKIRVYVPNPLLDNVLTCLFLAEVAWTAYIFVGSAADLWTLAVMLPCVAVLVWGVKRGTAVLCEVLNPLLPRRWDEDEGKWTQPLVKAKTRKKVAEQMWQLLVHIGMTAWEAYVLSDEPWMARPETAWIPHPFEQVVKPSLKLLYLAQLAVWIYTCYVHRYVDERHKDYFVMYLHHVVTIALVAGSASQQYYRIGLMVLFVHDASDIMVDTLKLVNLLALEGRQGWFASEIAFAINLGTWLYFRLWQFPTVVLHSAMFYSQSECTGLPYGDWIAHPDARHLFPPEVPLWMFTNALLCVLQALHVWWFYLFLRILAKLLTKGAHQAGREEYEGDSNSDSE